MNVTVRKIGNSEVSSCRRKCSTGTICMQAIHLNLIDDKEGLTLKPMDALFERQMKAALEIMDQYKVALQKLAE